MKATRKYYAYGSILEALSFGLYPDKRHVLREFIQNAFDAMNEFKHFTKSSSIAPLEIKLEPPSIFIADKGMGMSGGDVEKYRFLGYSEKDRSKTVGFRGIGKDSGLAIADKIIVTTSKIGVPKQYMIVIDSAAMLAETGSKRNPPLDTLLEKYGTVTETTENKDAHYTFVELHRIRKDANALFDMDKVKDYIRRHCPILFDPEFIYEFEVDGHLRHNVSDYSSIEILLNGDKLFKPYPQNYTKPEYEYIFESDEEGSPLLAFSWYCGHTEKGQFEDKDNSGLVYRVKNFAIGDRTLTRKTLWLTAPERAYYFFGEIHILDSEVIPSTDRTDFQDNDARDRLYARCRRAAQVLNQRAGVETDRRRLEEKTQDTESLITGKRQVLKRSGLSDVLKPDIKYQIRKSVEDLEKRLQRAKGRRKQSAHDKEINKAAEHIVKEGNKLLKEISQGSYFYQLEDHLQFNEQARAVYTIIIDCLKEEFKNKPELLERLITKIDQELMKTFIKISHG
jgi:hypothetical protein